MTTPSHSPRGFPLCLCGEQAQYHRPSHNPSAFPICKCGALATRHRVKHAFKLAGGLQMPGHPKGQRAHGGSLTLEALDSSHLGPVCVCGLSQASHLKPTPKGEYRIPFVGIDGEGVGRRPHKYILLCAATEDGRHWELENLNGLHTEPILNWVLETLDRCRVFSFAFGYDITMMLRDLPNRALYRLMRPSLRYGNTQGDGTYRRLNPVTWRGFSLNWLQGQLTVAKGDKRVVIWDIYKFFQSSFVTAITRWGISTEAIEHMKAQRSRFRARDIAKIRDYCLTECRQIATLSRKLIETHKSCGLTLTTYYGPGSTASVAIAKMGALDYCKAPREAMREAIASAFFGGRFEHSMMGPVKEVYGYDISSAYPYQLYQLPCLRHGRWTHVTSNVAGAINSCTTALVHYRYRLPSDSVWAAYPHRSSDGSICYPFRSEGWAWLPEIRAAQLAGMGATSLVEAWVYCTECQCHPFAEIATYYRRRVELGKDAAGIVLKLAVNSVYGKLAQSKGPHPKYQSWIWAGLVTSGTRAQLLTAIAAAGDPSDIIGVATDGVYSRTKLDLPRPVDTGTYDLPKPLGGWEETYYPDGMLFIKPGIYLSMGAETVRARGIGRKAVIASKDELLAAWERGDKQITITVDRFHGAKTSISSKLRRSERFGQWSRMPIRVAFACPNRGPDMSLLERKGMSVPYERSMLDVEKYLAIQSDAIAYEQP